MDNRTLAQLGMRLFGKRASDVDDGLMTVERLFPLSARFRDLLIRFGGAIVFDNGARYKPDEATPLTKADGYNNLEMLYGLGSATHSIVEASTRYSGELPPSFVPIGEAPGGNLVCVNADGRVFLWDHESARGARAWQVAASLDGFLDKLQPDVSATGSTDGIVESESFLGF